MPTFPGPIFPGPTFTVPVVDIAPYVGDGSADEQARTAAAMDQAHRTVGFVRIVGHAFAQPVIDELASGMARA